VHERERSGRSGHHRHGGGADDGQELRLGAWGAISGTVTVEATSAPLVSQTVSVYRSVGSTAVLVGSNATNAAGFYLSSLPVRLISGRLRQGRSAR
jgi:hypothetical protein